MRVDDPSDGDADDRIPEHDHVRSADPTEAPDREECYRDLRAYDQVPRHRPADRRPDEPGFGGDGRWKWKGLELSPEANRAADEGLAVRQAAEGRDAEGNYGEGGLTPAMRRVEAELEHGTLLPDTEKFALKSPDRFKEKLAKMISLEPDVTSNDHVARIHDGIRYTFIFEDQFYSAGVRAAENCLAGHGYKLVGRKPSWLGKEYRGINTQWRDPASGQLFEVQFHTPASWDAKQRTHDSYEKVQNPATPAEERGRLRDYQREIASSVTIPPGALEFATYKEEGR
jgi:hypothetical protein